MRKSRVMGLLLIVVAAVMLAGCSMFDGDWKSEMGPKFQNPSVFDGQHPLGVAQTNVVEAVKR